MPDQLIPIQFTGGLGEHVDPRLLTGPAILSMQNARIVKDGGLSTRNGYGTLNNVHRGKRLAIREQELFMFDNDGVDGFDENTGVVSATHNVTPFKTTRDEIAVLPSAMNAYTVAYANGVYVFGWIDSQDGNPWAAAVNNKGTVVYGPIQLAIAAGNHNAIRMCVLGNTCVVAYSRNSAAIKARTMDLTSPSSGFTVETTISSANMVSTSGVWAMGSTSTLLYLAYERTGATPLETRTLNSSLVVQNTASLNPAGGIVPYFGIALKVTTGETLWIAWAQSPAVTIDVYVIGENPTTFAQTVAATALYTGLASGTKRISVERVSATRCVVAAGEPAVASNASVRFRYQDTSAVPPAAASTLFNVGLATDVFVANNTHYMGVFKPGSLHGGMFIVDLLSATTPATGTIPLPVGCCAPRQMNPFGASFSLFDTIVVPSVAPIAAGTKFAIVAPVVRSATGRQGISRWIVDMTAGDRWTTDQIAGLLSVTGAISTQLDGSNVCEDGFLWAPEIITIASAGAGLITAGTRSYVCVYEWTDDRGLMHRSAPSIAVQYIAGAGDKARLTIRTLTLTQRQLVGGNRPIYVVIYRTDAGGTVLRRVTTEPYPTANQNLLTVASVQIDDNLPDANLDDGTHPFLYTEGGVFDNVCPPGVIDKWVHKQRIHAIDETRKRVWFTEETIPPDAPAWHDEFTIDFGDETLVKGISNGENSALFAEQSVWIIQGEGPSRTGAGNDLNWRRVSKGFGCTEPRSVVSTPVGIFFLSQRGMMLLGPDGGVSDIGKPVRDDLLAYPVVTGAVFVPSANEVRFTLAQSEGSLQGKIIVFDTERGIWGNDVIPAPDSQTTACAFISCALLRGTFTALYTGDPTLVQEDAISSSRWRDFGQFIPVDVTTSQIRVGGLSGYQRIHEVFLARERRSAHGVETSIFTDDRTASDQTSVRTEAQITAMRATEDIRIVPKRGGCKAIKLRIKSTAPAVLGTGEGMRLQGITLKVAVDGRPFSLLRSEAKG